MNTLTEKAFKDADHAARLLGDMKHSIYDVKIGDENEKNKLEILLGFKSQAEDILKNLADSIAEAIFELDKKSKDYNPDPVSLSHTLVCSLCGHGIEKEKENQPPDLNNDMQGAGETGWQS